jgi:hypothetical protein
LGTSARAALTSGNVWKVSGRSGGR